jgi:DNA polymerase-3 subunit delta
LHLHGLHDKSPRSVASSLKINPYFANEYIAATRNYPMKKVSGIIATLREFDVKSKGVGSNAVGQSDLLKEMIVRIMS